ncbi:MAG: hypothetical protein HPY68_05255 [Candidatus Atribacteria bacterium]|nr:hypothetical protein [Candidatus Atribacteria bacterium]
MERIKVVLILGLLVFFVSGCARGEQPTWGTGSEIVITLTMRGNVDSGVEYLVALDTDGNVLTGPKKDPAEWSGFYVLRWAGNNFYLRNPNGEERFFSGGSVSGSIMKMDVDLSDLGKPSTLDVMVVTTDKGGNILDSLGNYFTVRLGSQSYVSREDASADTGNASSDILRVEIEVRR